MYLDQKSGNELRKHKSTDSNNFTKLMQIDQDFHKNIQNLSGQIPHKVGNLIKRDFIKLNIYC